MAEDLKIRVKVEPNTTGLQGKLDEAAKNYKLNVELFDKKGLESQILAIRKSIKDLVSQTSKDLTMMAVSMNTQSKTMATGISQLASSFGTVEAAQSKVIKNQEKINDSLTKKKPIKIYDKAEIRELEFAVSKMKELRKKLDDDSGVSDVNNTNRFKNELNKVIKSEGVGNATVDTKSLKNAVNSDLEILQKYIDDKDHLIEKSKNADGKITYNLNKEISNIIKDQSTSGASFISSLYNQLLQIDDAVDETDASFEQFGDGWKKIVSYLKSDSDDIDESFEAMASGASSYLTGILNIGDNLEEVYSKIQKFVDIGDTNGAIDYLKKYATLYREFIYESGITQEAQPTNIVFNDKFKKQLDKEINQAESELIKAKSQIDEKAKDVITSVTKASESIGKTASENVSSSFESFDIKGKSKNLLKLFDEIFSDINTKAKSNSQVIQDFKSKITAPLYEIERNVGEAFDSDYISNLDEGSKETASHMSNLAMASSEAHKELTKLFGEIGGGSASSTQFAEFVVQLQKIYEYMTNLSDESAKIGDFKIGTASIPEAVSDDVMTKNAAKLEEAVQRLITLQTNLTIEKQRTLSVEKEIVDATNSGTEKLKQTLDNQRRVTASAKQAQGKTNIDKPDDKPAKDAEEHSGKAKDNLQAAADAVKELKTKGLDTVLKTVQKFVDGVCSDQSKVSAVSDKISEFNTKMAGFESAVTNYCKAITDLNAYFEQNAAILSALKGAYDIDSAQEKNKVKKETEQQTSAKITALLNKVNTSSEKIVSAVNDASNALKEISTALSAAAESAGSINGDGQIVLGAIQKLDTIFQQYSKALNNAGILNAADKPADEKTATTKKHKTKKKETVTEPTDTVSASIKKMEAVFDEFTAVAEATTGFAGKVDAVISAGDSIKEIIAKFNSIGDGSAESAQKTVEDQQAAIQEISAQVKASKTALAKSDSGIQQATTAVQEAVESASGIDTDAQALIKAGKVLGSIFKAYAKILDELQDSVDKVSGVDAKTITASMTKMKNFVKNAADAYAEAAEKATAIAKVDKKTVKKEKTEKADAQKADTKPIASIDTDKLNQVASDIRSVMAKFNRVAKTTDTFAENINKLLDAGTKISKVIKKFNGIDTTAVETVKSNVAAKVQTGDVISANNDNTAKVATAAKDIENAGSNIEKAASKIDTAADKTSKAADKEVKKANPLTADNAQREYKSTSDKYSKAEEYYKKNVVGTKFEDADTIKYYEELVTAMSKATSAKAEFDKTGSADALVAYQIALRDAADAFKVFDTKLDLVRDHFSEVNTRLNNLGKSLNTRFTSLKENYAIVENLQAKASAKGYENLASLAVSDQFSDAFKEANDAVEKFNKDQSFESADNARAKLTALSVAIQAYRKELTEAESISKKAFEALPTKIEQVKSRIASLVEQQKKTTKDSESYNILQEQIGNLTGLLEVLQKIDTEGSYSQFTDMFRQFQGIGDKNSIKIKSLTSLLSAFGIEARDATSQVRNLNTELRNTRNINSWEKSMQNTMYTAQRYFNNNSKISTNTEAYARFVDFFNTYDEKIKSKAFTQENSSQMSKDWSELKKYIQDAGLETDKLSVKLKKLFEVNIKSQLANQVINAFQQGLRQVYQNVVDIDSAMTELKKVTDETSGAYSKFLSEAGDRAKAVGSTVSDIVNATADYARLGYSLDDAKTLADVSAVYYNVGDDLDSFTTATDNIVGTMKAFNLEADDAIGLVDKLNAVSNNFAVSSGDLGNILQRSASAMEAAGNTLDQTIALGTAMNSVLQSADTTGTTLKVLALRLRGASTELASMGEETDGVATSTSKLRAQIAALTNVDGSGGFDILTDSGAFKSTYDIIQGIAKVYDRMSDVDQASLLELVAGKNRANGVAALLKQASQAEDVLQTSLNSSGKQNCLYVQKCA